MIQDIALPGAGAHLLVPPQARVQGRDGALPAEHLSPGDAVIGRRGGYVLLTGLCRVHLATDLVRVEAGFLPGMAPAAPLILPGGQSLWHNGRIVPASALVDEGAACPMGRRDVTLIVLGLQRADVIFAGGLELCAEPVRLPRAA